MKSRIILSTLLIFQFSSGFTIAAIFQISRTKPQGYFGWENGIDYFGMTPASMCEQTSEYECGVFKAVNVVPNCNCSCTVEQSTFTAFENQWTCIENSEVRTNLQSRQYSEPGEKGNVLNLMLTVLHERVSKFYYTIVIFRIKFIFYHARNIMTLTLACVHFLCCSVVPWSKARSTRETDNRNQSNCISNPVIIFIYYFLSSKTGKI